MAETAGRSYAGLDEALVPLHQHLAALLPQIVEITDPTGEKGIELERLELSMPIEMDIVPEDEETVSVGTSPPLYYVETGFGAAPHQLRVTIVAEHELHQEEP